MISKRNIWIFKIFPEESILFQQRYYELNEDLQESLIKITHLLGSFNLKIELKNAKTKVDFNVLMEDRIIGIIEFWSSNFCPESQEE